MRFVYQYRTRENELCTGEVCAPSREAAFAVLKSNGIRPARVVEAPGFFNKLFGKGKRWIAIVVLLSVSLALFFVVVRQEQSMSTLNAATDELTKLREDANYERRGQIYGDPAVLTEAEMTGWSNVFSEEGDRFLASYAIPGRRSYWKGSVPLKSLELCIKEESEIKESDYAEIAKMKRMVNWIKREALSYLADGGSIESYVKRLEARQAEEVGYFNRISRELMESGDMELWRERNASLRSMGLPMVEYKWDSRDEM